MYPVSHTPTEKSCSDTIACSFITISTRFLETVCTTDVMCHTLKEVRYLKKDGVDFMIVLI